MESNIVKKEKLIELANLLIEDIKTKNDLFETSIIVVPDKRLGAWFKSYWLKTEENVLMNINFKTIDEILPTIFNTEKKYKLVNRKTLRSFIISLLTKNEYLVNNLIGKYIYDDKKIDGSKLFDISEELSKLFIKYESEMISIEGFQKDIYDEALNALDNLSLTTLKGLYDRKIGYKEYTNTLYLFGFSDFDNLTKRIFCEYENINPLKMFLLEASETKNYPHFSLFSAPSKEREIINIHSMICKKIQEENYMYSDFLVLAPDVSEYEAVVSRIFKQDDTNFPNIPYSITSQSKNNELLNGLNILSKIIKRGYFSRFDVIDLLNNKIIMAVRNLSYEDVNVYLEAIARMNIFRDRSYQKDFKYIKKRMLLSKIISINQVDNNIITLNDTNTCEEVNETSSKDYMPYTNISLTDDLIIKFIDLIDDLYDWIDNFKLDSIITVDSVNKIISSLQKWFYVDDTINELSNKELINVLKELNNWLNYNLVDEKIPLSTLLRTVLDISSQKSIKSSEMFTRGVTFANYDENAILSSKYMFLIGFSSNNFPKQDTLSELDLTLKKKVDSYDIFKLQVNNATEDIVFSYVNNNLKTEEEYFLSNYIVKIYKENGINDDELKQKEIKISLDETRNWNELYTKKEFNDRNHYIGLFLNLEESDNYPLLSEEKPKRITISKMKDFLTEPLKFKAEYLFSIYDSIGDKLNDEFEPFKLNNLDEYSMTSYLMKYILENKAFEMEFEDVKNVLKTYIDNNYFATINDDFVNYRIGIVMMNCFSYVSVIYKKVENNYKIIDLKDIDLVIDDEVVTIRANDSICVSTKGNTRTYFELKKFKTDYSECLKLYIESLVDIASLNDETEYCVELVKGPRTVFTYDINSNKAADMLKNIYKAMFDSSMNKYFECVYAKKDFEDKKMTYFDLIADFYGNLKHGSVWSFFKDSKIFTTDKLGYTEENFNEEFENMKTHINELTVYKKRGKKNA